MGIVSYAQNFEDVILWRALHEVSQGFYIDIGAQHPVVDSVSKAFYEHGWRGIHIEPTTEHANLLRADRLDETVVQAVVADHAGVIHFYEIPGSGLSTACKDIAEEHNTKLGCQVVENLVTAVTLDDVLELAPNEDTHWLKVDVEGFEKEVFSGWRESSRRPWIIVIEATYPNTTVDTFEQWETLVLEKGYALVYQDGLNRFYLSDQHAELQPRFHFPPNVFDGFQLSGTATSLTRYIVERFDQERAILSAQKADVESQLSEQRQAWQDENAQLERMVEALRGQYEQARREAQDQIETLRMKSDQAIDVARAEAQSRLKELLEQERGHTERLEALQREAKAREETLRQAFEAQLSEQRQAWQDKNAQLERTVEALRGQMAEIDTIRTLLQEEFDQSLHTIRRLSTEINAIRQSWSWYLTAPFRSLKNKRSGLHDTRLLTSSLPPPEGERELALLVAPVTTRQERDATGRPCPATATVAGEVPNTLCQPKSTNQEAPLMSIIPAQTLDDLLALPAQHFIDHAYGILLKRSPDPEGMHYYQGRLRAGYGRASVLAQIARSPECSLGLEKLLTVGSDNDFLEAIYLRYLERKPDSTGLQHYRKTLKSRADRKRVASDIACSRESMERNSFWRMFDQLMEEEKKNETGFWNRLTHTKQIQRKLNQQYEGLVQIAVKFTSAYTQILARVEQLEVSTNGQIRNAQDEIAIPTSNFEKRYREKAPASAEELASILELFDLNAIESVRHKLLNITKQKLK